VHCSALQSCLLVGEQQVAPNTNNFERIQIFCDRIVSLLKQNGSLWIEYWSLMTEYGFLLIDYGSLLTESGSLLVEYGSLLTVCLSFLIASHI